MRNPGMGPIFLHCNRNKRSIVLDLKQPEGREAVLRLAATADVFVFNVRPQAMQRLGLSYDAVRAARPDIVYASLCGFGQDGPYADRPAYDDLIQGAAGIPWLSMAAGAESPSYAPSALADRIVGIAATNAILAALLHRARTGEGQAVEVPMFETMAQFTLGDHLAGQSFVPGIGPAGYLRILNPNRKPYRTTDGHICAMFYTDRHWQAFFALIGQPGLFAQDERFSTMGRRTENSHLLYEMVADAMATRTTAEWEAALAEADIPHMPMNSLDELVQDPHLNAVGFITEQTHPSEGAIRAMRTPARWSATPATQRHHAPHLGEHTDELLREAGYGEADIAALRAREVLARLV
jgi:crotonobetainyl-CoA:carnitine CoA-transferase CaiB-like acyl-CoA transferase